VPANGSLELVLPDHSRVPIQGEVTIGRAPENSLRLADPSVSRHHARISFDPGDPGADALLEDVGSSYGTWLDGESVTAPCPVRDGDRIVVGDQELTVERVRDPSEPGRTIVVPTDRSLLLASAQPDGAPGPLVTRELGAHPRMRSGYALKRLGAEEGEKRWLLKDLRSSRFLRLSDGDATLLELLDGSRSLPDLVRDAEERLGSGGRARLPALLAELAQRGFLAGTASAAAGEPAPRRGWRGAFAPREWSWSGAANALAQVYRNGGYLLFTRPALAAIVGLASAGLIVFAYLIAARYGTPFVVGSRVGLGGLVFVVGRLAIAGVHETAHGLTLASFGRRVQAAGIKLFFLVPYFYVDTSDAWFEPRRRRIAVSAAGPASDFTLGGLFSVCCLVGTGTVRDIFFQLAFAAYLGGLLNLNPLIERDGYQILVDVLREPRLRARAFNQLSRRLRGLPTDSDRGVVRRYALLTVAWTGLTGAFGVALSLRYAHELTRVAPAPVVWSALAVAWLSFAVVVAVVLARPLRQRARQRSDSSAGA
jgi:pSer/pThr/pTyr-binding forkhead associated (FHA) protein